MSKNERQRKAGRKHDPDAKWRKTTRAGRRGTDGVVDPGEIKDTGSLELAGKRQAIAGDHLIGCDFPLDVLLARGLISEDMRNEGLRYTMLAWWTYDTPHASCQGLYERVVSGVTGDDFVPRVRDMSDEQRKEYEERILSNKARFSKMERKLKRRGRLVFDVVRKLCMYLEMPRFVYKLAAGQLLNGQDHRELARICEGLEGFVEMRDEEDKHWQKKRKYAAVTAAGDKATGVFLY